MLDLTLIEQDFRFDTDRKIIMGMQGAKPKRLYTGNELYYYQLIVFDEPDMFIHASPMMRAQDGIYFLIHDWVFDDNAKASIIRDFIFKR